MMETKLGGDGSETAGAVSSISARDFQSGTDSRADWAQRAYVAELPSDFLRVPGVEQGTFSVSQREQADRQAALALQQHYSTYCASLAHSTVGKLQLTVSQAKLAKNYGLTRMDPYVRLRLGHCIYETQTCYNGATNPHWNKTVLSYVPSGVNSLHVEIYDECSFSEDSLIASTTVELPQSLLISGETMDDWFPLSGKQGHNKEGMINLIMSFVSVGAADARTLLQPSTRHLYSLTSQPGPVPAAVYHRPCSGSSAGEAGRSRTSQPVVSDSDVQQLREMFPSMDAEIVRSVLETRGGNKSEAISCLLEMVSQ